MCHGRSAAGAGLGYLVLGARFVWCLTWPGNRQMGEQAMPQCEYLDDCLFYNKKMPCDASLETIYRKHYCKGDFASCARFIVRKVLNKPLLLTDLYPNQQERAKTLVGVPTG